MHNFLELTEVFSLMDGVGDSNKKVDEGLLILLKEMGFEEEKARLALLKTGNSNLDRCIDFLSNTSEKDFAALTNEVPVPASVVLDPREEETRMIIVVRTDLKMGTGKIASQACHAAVALTLRMQQYHQEVLMRWNDNNTPKICVKVNSLEALEEIEEKATLSRIPCFSICDAGRTQIEKGSKTCVALCEKKKELDKLTGKLKLL